LGNPLLSSEFDQYLQTLIEKEKNEGWATELQNHLKEMPEDITKDPDIVEWCQVSISPIL